MWSNPKTKNPKIVYPRWKVSPQPTPNETLYICDHCNQAEWTQYSDKPRTHYCIGNKPQRLRKATEKEKQEALKALETVIGDHQIGKRNPG